MDTYEYPIFSVIGIEIEYMLVDKTNLSIQPINDKVIERISGHIANQIMLNNDIALSNELMMHVVELKNSAPVKPSSDLRIIFQKGVQYLNQILAHQNVMLLPSAAHPFMHPNEARRWPHDNQEIYTQYDKIFTCQGHGFSNLQSMHINLPFGNDAEFYRLHSLIRILLPLLPAIAASSPILEGKCTGRLDARLDFYAHNQDKIPIITGHIIPESIKNRNDYEKYILKPMYQAIAPYDPQGILQYEWLNSRGAMTKFDYGAIEIRIIDSQECVSSDIAIALFCHTLLRYWDTHCDAAIHDPMDTLELKKVYDAILEQGLNTRIDNKTLLQQWGVKPTTQTVRDVIATLIDRIQDRLDATTLKIFDTYLTHGNLSTRILDALKTDRSIQNIQKVYFELAECLHQDRLFGVSG